MTIRATTLAAAALAALATGCGNDKCPSEAPQVNAIANCTATAGQPVSYQLQLCPTCNQTISGCDVDMSGVTSSGGTIFLNPTVEACTSSASCGAGCSPNTNVCTFNAPSASANTTYTVSVYDPYTNTTKQGTLTIVTSGAGCSFPG